MGSMQLARIALAKNMLCADDFREERGCDGQVLQPTCFQKQLDVSWYFHNFVYSNTPRRFKNQLVLAK